MIRFLCFLRLVILFCCSRTQKQAGISYWVYEGCHVFLDTLDIKQVGHNLYQDTHQNIYFKSYNPENNQELLIKNIYYGCKEDFPDYQVYELKNKIDIRTFYSLQNNYYTDKNYLFYFFMNSNGGHLYSLDTLEHKSLHILPKSHFLIHRNNVYYMGQLIEKADYKTFQAVYKIQNKDTLFSFFGKDKNFYFQGLDICSQQDTKK